MTESQLHQKRTFVLGASSNPERYAYKDCKMLKRFGVPLVAVGLKPDVMDDGTPIQTMEGHPGKAHTITLYVGAPRQASYYSFIFESAPERIIFNPGAENPELAALAREKNIEVLEACTLVLLSTGQY
jgi:predicted CoA-binding protein